MNITIIGIGLIGSSIALSIKKEHPDIQLTAWDQNKDFLQTAFELGQIDVKANDLKAAVKEANLVILAVPVEATKLLLYAISKLPHRPNLMVTDTASTKFEIMEEAARAFNNTDIQFMGGHPMAGSHKTGPTAGDAYLFENAYYILVPGSNLQAESPEFFKDLMRGSGARFVEVDALEHDRVTSQISHFPHVLASELVRQAAEYGKEHEWTERFAAGGFRDMTRIAESDPQLWTSVLLSNTQAVLSRINDFQKRLAHLETLVQSRDKQQLFDFFDQGQKARKKMRIHHRAGVDSFFDLYVTVPDRKDVVLEVLEHIRGISIVNIHINEENREDIYGHLQLTFKNQADQEKAFRILNEESPFDVRKD